MSFTAKEILHQPLASFILDDHTRTLDVPSVRVGTTSVWATGSLRNVSLSPLRWDWKEGSLFEDFSFNVDLIPYKYNKVSPLTVIYPRNEADTAYAIVMFVLFYDN